MDLFYWRKKFNATFFLIIEYRLIYLVRCASNRTTADHCLRSTFSIRATEARGTTANREKSMEAFGTFRPDNSRQGQPTRLPHHASMRKPPIRWRCLNTFKIARERS